MKTADLKKILNLLIIKLDDFDDVIIDKEMYWNIPESQLYNVYENPNDFTIGSLVEDWTFLQDIISGNREILDYDLYKISMLLRYLSGKNKVVNITGL